jgi:hypothetical protein
MKPISSRPVPWRDVAIYTLLTYAIARAIWLPSIPNVFDLLSAERTPTARTARRRIRKPRSRRVPAPLATAQRSAGRRAPGRSPALEVLEHRQHAPVILEPPAQAELVEDMRYVPFDGRDGHG